MTAQVPTQFRTQAELIDFLGAMERRIAALEQENQQQQQAIDTLSQEQPTVEPAPVIAPVPVAEPAPPAAVTATAPVLPKTGLLSKNFMTRAFTVWGHEFVASLIILLVLALAALVVYLVVYGLTVANL